MSPEEESRLLSKLKADKIIERKKAFYAAKSAANPEFSRIGRPKKKKNN